VLRTIPARGTNAGRTHGAFHVLRSPPEDRQRSSCWLGSARAAGPLGTVLPRRTGSASCGQGSNPPVRASMVADSGDGTTARCNFVASQGNFELTFSSPCWPTTCWIAAPALRAATLSALLHWGLVANAASRPLLDQSPDAGHRPEAAIGYDGCQIANMAYTRTAHCGVACDRPISAEQFDHWVQPTRWCQAPPLSNRGPLTPKQAWQRLTGTEFGAVVHHHDRSRSVRFVHLHVDFRCSLRWPCSAGAALIAFACSGGVAQSRHAGTG